MSSISDNRITGAAGAARSVEALLCGLAAPRPLCLVRWGVTAASAVVTTVVTAENDGREPGVICTNTNGDCSTGGSIVIIVSDGTIADKFVSMSIFSGSFSIELIRITGFSAAALTDSVFTSGRSQFNANSSNNSALPTKPKYLSRGIGPLCVISTRTKRRLLRSQFIRISRQFRELFPRNERAGVGTENQDDESNNNGHCLPPSLLEQAYRAFLSAGLGELVFEVFSNSVNRAFPCEVGKSCRVFKGHSDAFGVFGPLRPLLNFSSPEWPAELLRWVQAS